MREVDPVSSRERSSPVEDELHARLVKAIKSTRHLGRIKFRRSSSLWASTHAATLGRTLAVQPAGTQQFKSQGRSRRVILSAAAGRAGAVVCLYCDFSSRPTCSLCVGVSSACPDRLPICPFLPQLESFLVSSRAIGRCQTAAFEHFSLLLRLMSVRSAWGNIHVIRCTILPFSFQGCSPLAHAVPLRDPRFFLPEEAGKAHTSLA